jgi:hypothetical protein
MKKLAVLLQIIGLLALCPIYVILEITHSSNKNSEAGQDSSVRQKTEMMNSQLSKLPDNKTQNATYYSNTK